MSDAEITRELTRERARLVSVRSYEIELDVTGGDEAFGSTTTICFDCASPSRAASPRSCSTGIRSTRACTSPRGGYPCRTWPRRTC